MITYRTATQTELAQILDWAAAEGWNPGVDDAAAFYAADPEGFFVAEDATGELVAALSVVNHRDDFAFLGLYIVRPDHRGKGIGLGLWHHGLLHADRRTVGLDGVEAQQGNYAVSGFVSAGGTTRYEGQIKGTSQPQIRLAGAGDVRNLIAMEAAASGIAKPRYLRSWFTPAPARITLLHETENQMTGLATVRVCRTGAKIGPLVGETAKGALGMIRHAATLFEGPFAIDVPDHATELAASCRALGLVPGFKTARMYRGSVDVPKHPNFAVASLELG